MTIAAEIAATFTGAWLIATVVAALMLDRRGQS
jgi:hypothetical protein